ncbi:Strongly-conserved Zn-finger binding protein (TFIIIA) [Puccinia graminis f. sp. tritici]|uniref:Strongly-conserved Zn-finger binding protein (TFIIIA) n=1 Tax=Puccinia graminis f. sp. tritici TaxID=56615 RepID=A0A5B0LSK7_PUCGR|nr:Strongly-conserved Zn-finger binding protein (TFIIIA) [Puccinia graminis f. sp. tritici]KAA1120401.1 Strongly-conserved Zn-finger binding protein (TFIIIA) [Puccinia graminis f. sp. tritici]
MIRSSGRKTKRKQPDSEPDSESESESERSSTTPETASSYSATTSESDSGSCTDSDQEPSSPPSHLPQLVIINGKLIDSRNKQADQLPQQGARKQRKYFCHWEGCQKSYTKPVRLEEHVRSHTNERPFGCPTCPAAYRRETHLTAHMRMHLPESSRPLLCGWQAATLASSSSSSSTTTSTASPEACPRRFWTQQQLRIHRENVHEGKKGQPKLRCDHCPQEFLKHRALRAHLLDAHCPQGTKPYMCPHPNCGFSFANPSRLRKHERTHEPNRYTCVHHDCLNNPSLSLQQRSFSSWTDLQRHTRDSHPFRCPEQDCSRNKKPFKSLRSLKQHLQVYHPPAQPHREGEEEEEEPMTAPGILASSARNTGAFICTQYPPCTRAYKSARALQRHVNLIHLIDRHTSCPFPGCSFSSAFPSGLAKHIKSKHPSQDPALPSSSAPLPKRSKLTRVQKLAQIDVLTGIGYSDPLPPDTNNKLIQSTFRKFACPFFKLNITHHSDPHHHHPHSAESEEISVQAPQPNQKDTTLNSAPGHPNPTEKNELDGDRSTEKCLFRFNRIYDIQRHLNSHHSLTVDRETLKDFFGVP